MKKVIDVHIEEYGSQPDVVVKAPGRFHLIGEHSWFFGDKTLSMAVDLPVYVAVSRRSDSSFRFYFPQLKERKRGSLSSLKYRKEDRWANVFKSIVFAYVSMGYSFCGMNVTIYSDILPSAGFGITTAMKVASAVAVKKLFNIPGDEKAVMQAIKIGCEKFLDTKYYASDINTALFSKKGCCLLTDHSKLTYSTIPFRFENTSIILTDARVPRISLWNEDSLHTEEILQLMNSLKETKNGQMVYENSQTEINEVLQDLSEDERKKLLCIIKEYGYLTDAVEALKSNTIHNFAKAVNKSHEIMGDLYHISCPEIDWLIKRVQEFDQNSVTSLTSCGRITGKGFGRCTYTILKNDYVEPYMEKLQEYERIFGFHPATYIVHPEDGAWVDEGDIISQ